jgi:hypothetical protein
MAIEPCLGGVIGIEDLVKDPAEEQYAENGAAMRQTDENREDEDMGKSFGKLAVVHRAHSGNKSEQAGQHGIRTGDRDWWRNLAGYGNSHTRCEAWLAVNHAADRAHALAAQRLSALLAIGRSLSRWMVGAGHAKLLAAVA